MAVSHVVNKALGPPNPAVPGHPVQYIINPIGIHSIILSASELGSSTYLSTNSLEAFSANVTLQPSRDNASKITFPIVQGMGFVTALYTNLRPEIQSSVFFRTVTFAGSPKPPVYKWRAILEDGSCWLIYIHSPSMQGHLNLDHISNTTLRGPQGFSGIVQIAKNPMDSAGEALYDSAVGSWAVSAQVSGSVNGKSGDYSLSWRKNGMAAPLLMYALPHHVGSFDSITRAKLTNMQMVTTTKGNATAVLADSWHLTEPDLPVDMEFAPWTPSGGSVHHFSDHVINAMRSSAAHEVSQDMAAQSNLDSMYFAGKALSKFATLVYTIHDLAKDPRTAATGLEKLKAAFHRFTDNNQIHPLVYDTAWKGLVSSATYKTGDPGMDFGNSFYNDHHFHWGYFIHTAAVIGYLDPSWLAHNKSWVNSLVRDTSNPSSNDPYFPVFRSFDWYHGHSWAKGVFESADGKDQESTSEDAFYAYAIKMWGKCIHDKSMEARGNLMLAVLARSFHSYFLMDSANQNQPANFIPNKVTGIVSIGKLVSTLCCHADRIQSCSRIRSTTPHISA